MNNLCKCIYCGSVFVPLMLVGEIFPSVCYKCQPTELPKHTVEENYMNKISSLPMNATFINVSVASGFAILN